MTLKCVKCKRKYVSVSRTGACPYCKSILGSVESYSNVIDEDDTSTTNLLVDIATHSTDDNIYGGGGDFGGGGASGSWDD